MLKDGLPGALVTSLILGVHDFSHILVAKSSGVKLGVPYFVPSWQVRSMVFPSHMNFYKRRIDNPPKYAIRLFYFTLAQNKMWSQ